MKNAMDYEVIIIGGSYAGLSAAMSLGRALRHVLIVDNGEPCNRQTPHSHNFLTNDGQTPAVLAAKAQEQVRAYDTIHFSTGLVTDLQQVAGGFSVKTNEGKQWTARKIVLATGIRNVFPDIPGWAACWGISVLHCPYCHGYEVRNEPTGIFGGGEAVLEMAALIHHWTKQLTVFTHTETRPGAASLERFSEKGIGINTKEIEAIEHRKGYLEQLVFTDGSRLPLTVLYAKLPFVQQADFSGSLGYELMPDGFIKVDALQKTTVYGLFACGDNSHRLRTVAHAVAAGTAAGMAVNRELIDEAFYTY